MGEGEQQEVLLWKILPQPVKQEPGNKRLSLTSASLGSGPALSTISSAQEWALSSAPC